MFETIRGSRVSGSSIFSNCGSGFRIRIPDPDPGFDDLKLKKIKAEKKFNFFLIKNFKT
jgi:hypothetical protein